MLYLSQVLIEGQDLGSFSDLLRRVRARAADERFLRIDVKPSFPDTPADWETLLEAAFSAPAVAPAAPAAPAARAEAPAPEGGGPGGGYLDHGAPLWSRELAGAGGGGVASERAASLEASLESWPQEAGTARAGMLLELAEARLDAGETHRAWTPAREAFDSFLQARQWEPAVRAARALYLAGSTPDTGESSGSGTVSAEDAMAALGQGIWLAVSMPVDPELSVAMLQHLIDETPDDADGAAVAAATASFVADLRTGPGQEAVRLFAGRMLAEVARRHSRIEEQAAFEAWVTRLELDDPDRFLVRLRNVIDVLVQDRWWFDPETLRQGMPE